MSKKKNVVQAFSFGEPEPVLDRADILNYFESVVLYDKYYYPPMDFSGLARLLQSSSHHQSAINVNSAQADDVF